jgi:hypothetical protein
MFKKIGLLLAVPVLLFVVSAFIGKKPINTAPAVHATIKEETTKRWLPFLNNTQKVQAPKRLVTDVLYPNQALNPGEILVSANGDYTLIMQHDGNLVLYDYWGSPVWDSGTCCTSDMSGVLMQTDGNLVMYDIYAVPHWASNTSTYPNGYAWVTNWGTVYVIQGGLVRWSSTW